MLRELVGRLRVGNGVLDVRMGEQVLHSLRRLTVMRTMRVTVRRAKD